MKSTGLEAPAELSCVGVKTGRFPFWNGEVVFETAQRTQPRRLEGVTRELAGALDIPVVVADASGMVPFVSAKSHFFFVWGCPNREEVRNNLLILFRNGCPRPKKKWWYTGSS